MLKPDLGTMWGIILYAVVIACLVAMIKSCFV